MTDYKLKTIINDKLKESQSQFDTTKSFYKIEGNYVIITYLSMCAIRYVILHNIPMALMNLNYIYELKFHSIN